MKLNNELAYVVDRFHQVKNAIPYAQEVYEGGHYKNFQVRIAWDIARASIPSGTMCSWYDKYECNDDHLTTLFKVALKAVFPQIYEMGGK